MTEEADLVGKMNISNSASVYAGMAVGCITCPCCNVSIYFNQLQTYLPPPCIAPQTGLQLQPQLYGDPQPYETEDILGESGIDEAQVHAANLPWGETSIFEPDAVEDEIGDAQATGVGTSEQVTDREATVARHEQQLSESKDSMERLQKQLESVQEDQRSLRQR